MSRDTAIRVFCFLWGAAVGAALQGVAWTWWAAWAVAWLAFGLIGFRHRNGGPAHA